MFRFFLFYKKNKYNKQLFPNIKAVSHFNTYLYENYNTPIRLNCNSYHDLKLPNETI